MEEKPVERFKPTSGRLTGIIGLLAIAAIVGGTLAESGLSDVSWAFVSAWGLVAVLLWAAVLRPRMRASEEHLEMRGMFATVTIPLAAVEEVAVRQVTAVRVGEQRFVCSAVGRTWRQAIRTTRPDRDRPQEMTTDPQVYEEPPMATTYADFVENRISQLAGEARDRAGITIYSPEQEALWPDVRRERAWLEIGGVVVTGAAFVVALIA